MNKLETKSAQELIDELVEDQKALFRTVVNELDRITKSLSSLITTIRTVILEDHKNA